MRRKRRMGFIFRAVSIVFIIACCIFYGLRLVKYYKIFNPKQTAENEGLLSISIPKNSQLAIEGDGLYRLSGSYVYKGNVENNYIRFSGMLFRIVKIQYGGPTEIILDEPINYLSYDEKNSSFGSSNIKEYINNEFIKRINKNYLIETESCSDEITDLKNLSCEKKEKMFVKLLDVTSFLNSMTDKTYLNTGNFWLSNVNEKEVWYANENNISSSESNNLYGVRPVLNLKYDTLLSGGTGTKDDPYQIDEEEIVIGKYVKIGEDIWQIYDQNKTDISLIATKNLNKSAAFSLTKNEFDVKDEKSVANYLNTTYLESLAYKDLLLETDYCTGTYTTDYKTICKTKVKAKVALSSIIDKKFANNSTPYFLMNGNDNKEIYIYGSEINTSKVNLSRSIRPVITIKNTSKKGTGTLEDPLVIEV